MTPKQLLVAFLGCVVFVLASDAASAQGALKGDAASPRGGGKTPDACAVLMAAGVNQLLGGKAEQRPMPGQSGDTGPLCLYEQPRRAAVSLGLVAGLDKKTTADAERDRMRRVGGKVQDEPELGSGAFSSSLGRTTTLVAFKGELVINLQFANVEAALIMPFAKRVLASV